MSMVLDKATLACQVPLLNKQFKKDGSTTRHAYGTLCRFRASIVQLHQQIALRAAYTEAG
jgi:hypothetical protein